MLAGNDGLGGGGLGVAVKQLQHVPLPEDIADGDATAVDQNALLVVFQLGQHRRGQAEGQLEVGAKNTAVVFGGNADGHG